MHLTLRLPKIEPNDIPEPTHCPFHLRNHRPCTGQHFKLHQVVCRKPLRDTQYAQVICQRYRCLTCGRSFRVYPVGVSPAHQSDTLKGLSILLYILGVSYQGVADLLDSLGQPMCKTTVYNNVQAAGRRARQLREQWVQQQAGRVKVLGLDCTHVKRNRQDRIVAVATAVLTGEPVTFDLLEAEGALRIEHWVRELARVLGAEILVTDDADGLKTVADHLGLQHQICRAHVNRNVHDLIAALGTPALERPDPVPGELAHTVTLDQFLEDLEEAEWIIRSVPADGQARLEKLSARYQGAPPPSQGHRATMWFRMRRFTLDWSENWSRLTLYQHWRGDNQAQLDGTNNLTEQVIGQCVKERYRTMRGYKRDESIVNVSSLIGWARGQTTNGNLSDLVKK
jgi:transposase-like protein